MCKQFNRKCGECGVEFIAKDRRAEFCGTPCRVAHTNRRRDRGAMLYDMYVHLRFNREAATEEGLRTLIDRMVGNWVEEDRELGRRVMRPMDDVKQAALPHTVVRCNIRAGK